MKKLTLWYPGSFQHFQIEGTAWRTLPPHPMSRSRLVQRAAGEVRLVPPPKGGGSYYEHVLLDIDDRNRALSLGRSNSVLVPDNNTIWAPAKVMTSEEARGFGPQNLTYRLPKYLSSVPAAHWTTQMTPDPSTFWIGVYASTDLTLPGARAGAFVSVVWKLGQPQRKYIVIGTGGYIAAGGGISASAGVVFFTGFKSIQSLAAYADFDAGIQVSVGKNWAKTAAVLKRYDLDKFYGLARKYRRAGASIYLFQKRTKKYSEQYENFKEIKDKYEKFKKLNDEGKKFWRRMGNAGIASALEAMSTVEFAKMLLSSAGIDGSKPGMQFIELAGGGEGLAIYAGSRAIEAAYPL